MGLSVTGYVLEPPRVGDSNSPFTYTPNVYVSSQGAFDAAYPSNESAPRTEYHVFVLQDYVAPGTGPGDTRSFVDARFCWTKNEVIQRFDYAGAEGRFRTIPGSVLEVAGTMAADANTNRLQVTAPISSDLGSYPVRVSVGTGSGTTLTAATVLNDGAFTVPSVGTVQISLDTGNLNWNAADITTYLGQPVRFQRQTFYQFSESSGNLGIITDPLLLNPLPATGQKPLLRIGFGEYLTPVEVVNEAGFSPNPAAGTVEWASNTGRLKFNSGDTSANAGRAVYYDGSCFGFSLAIKTFNLGTVNTPGVLSPLPPEASDLFFRVVDVVQFPQVSYVDTLTTPGKKGVVQVRRSDGQIQFSDADKGLYGALSAQAVVADLDIERGMTLRMSRSPVNLDNANPDIKDVSAFYVSEGAVLADPTIGFPSVSLPAVPVDTKPLTVEVTQGTGSFTGTLPRLDVLSPPTGLGYIIDFEEQELLYAQRKENLVLSAPAPYPAVQLPDPLLFLSNLLLEVETAPSSGVYNPLTIGEDALVDLASGLITMVQTQGELLESGSAATFSGTVLTDGSKNFTTAGVQPGDYLLILSGPAKGVYLIDVVGTTTLTTAETGVADTNVSYEVRQGSEVLADRYLYEVPPLDPNTKVERLRSLGAITNSPRLQINATQASDSRFRFGKTTFSNSVVQVANDGAFTAPGSLAAGTVEVSLTTGNLNFSQTDVTAGGEVYWSRTLTMGSEYKIQPALGFIQFAERFLELEEAFITYKNSDGDLVEERGSFLVRKEETSAHPSPTSTLEFNPLGREVAAQPAPRAYRGGRPQSALQVTFDLQASTVKFIGATTVTDALPSGPTIQPNETVLVDYSLHEAIGGEQVLSVLQPPMQTVPIVISEGATEFQIAGDRTDVFGPSILLVIDRTETYLIGSSSYSSGMTTVQLASPQVFRSDFQDPPLAVSSGPLRVVGTPVASSYFLTELTSYDPVPRGSPRFKLAGDGSRTYVSGTVVLFSGVGFTDYNVVSGSTYDEGTNRTEVVMIGNGARQYTTATLKRSVRPVLASPSASVNTTFSPELGQPYQVIRKIEGQVGQVLTEGEDYKIDGAGVVVLTEPLVANEAVQILYTGDVVIEAGRSFRASYTFGVVPSDANGLLNQVLKADYTTYIPDTFFWRVETFTNFRGELVEAYEEEAKSTVPTGGPTLENTSQPRLFEQGRESVFFEEGYLANEDLVARPTLKYFNDAINYLEDALQSLDGRVVGGQDGRFLFDGNIDNPERNTFLDVTNQIDDRFKISPAPYTVTGPPFVAVSIGTYREVYKPAATSRFYPTRRNRFGATVDPSGLETGDPLLDIGAQNLTSVTGIRRRFPWAVMTAQTLAGGTVLNVDDADGSDVLLRPAFENGMAVAIIAQDGTVLVSDASALTVSAVTATTLTVGAVPVTIPIGATVRLATIDTTYYQEYRLGIDVGVDLEKGLLTHLAPSPVWGALTPLPPTAGEALDMVVTLNNTLTEPDRFPALDGGTEDDDRNRQFPILTPAAISETSDAGYLTTEKRIIETGTGTLRTSTQDSFVGVGNLNGTGTIITLQSGTFPSPTPTIHDLVEIRTGPNAPSTFHRITATTASSVTVATAFPVPLDTGFTFAVTVSNTLETGTADAGSTSSSIVDAASTFISNGVLPGHTVVGTSGGNTGLRRQVTAVVSETNITCTAFPSTMNGQSYRIENPIQTFGGANSIHQELEDALTGELAVISTNTTAIDDFFNTVFTNIVTGVNGVSSTSTFTSAGQTFVTSGTTSAHLLFIRSGSVAGFYKIQSVDSETSLTIEGTFPVNIGGISYRVVKSVGLTAEPLNGVLDAALNAEGFVASTQTFLNLVSTNVTVDGDAGAVAIRLIESDLDAREIVVDARVTQVPTDITGIESELSAGDRLYDRRYVWIDARINVEKGILVRKDLAVLNRIKAQQETLKQLTKLLAVQQM